MRVTFDKITAPASVSFRCAKCGNRRTRKQVFWMTCNPFNRDSNGVPKSREQVRTDVQQKAREWEKSVTLCATCEASQ